MHIFFQSRFCGIIMSMAIFCTVHLSCNSTQPTQPPLELPTKTTLSEMKISEADMPSWADSVSNQDTFCIYSIDSLYAGGWRSINGGAVPYDSIGCKRVAFQSLTDLQQMAYSVY